jgi:hypothetical protein
MNNMRNFENFTKVEYDSLGIDWSRVAEPQLDNYDIQSINLVANKLFGYEKPIWPEDKPRIFDGNVALHFKGSQSGGSVIVLESGDVRLNRLDYFNDFFKNASPKYYQSVCNFLDVYVPTYDTDTPDYVGIGCMCGPVCKSYETYDTIDFPCIGVSSNINTEVGGIDGIIHESFHQRLYQLGVEMEDSNLQLISNDPEKLYPSPIRFDVLRPMTACVQAIYSYVCVSEYYTDVIKYGLGTDSSLIDKYGISGLMSASAYNIHRISNGRILMRRDLDTSTNAGKQFFAAFFDFMDRVIDSSIEVMKPYESEFGLKWTPNFK